MVANTSEQEYAYPDKSVKALQILAEFFCLIKTLSLNWLPKGHAAEF